MAQIKGGDILFNKGQKLIYDNQEIDLELLLKIIDKAKGNTGIRGWLKRLFKRNKGE